MKRFHRLRTGVAGLVIAASGVAADAHHSYTSFDRRFLTLTGTVKSYQYTNPHIWIQTLVKNADGSTTEWGVETGSPASMRPMGLTSRLLKPGDRITLVIHPKRDGRKEGSLVKLALSDGRTVSAGDLVTLGAKPPEQ